MHFLGNLGAMLIRPRQTMRRILDAPGSRMVLPLVVLVAISGILGDFDAPMLQRVIDQAGGWNIGLIVAGVILLLIAATVGLFYVYAWVPFLIGRFVGGTGEIRDVRAALAWGLAPGVWALLYRLPAVIWFAASGRATSVRVRDGGVSFDPGMIVDGCGIALVFALLELIVFVWCAFVMSNTVAEAHGFTAWHGLGTLVLAAIAPLVVTLAAVLAMM